IYAPKNMNNQDITNLADPVNDQDAGTKAYVDEIIDNLYIQGVLKLVDIDGNQYEVVKIGNQIWMAEDLRVTHYPNGDPIPNVTDNTAWGNLAANNTDDAYCFYNNNNTTDYGALYTYAAAIGDNWLCDNAAGQGVCPDGWQLPTDVEWITLTTYLGGTNVAGGKMKETGTTHWQSPNTGATNETSFTALPNGFRYGNSGTFSGLGYLGNWWSATESSGSNAWVRALHNNSAGTNSDYSDKSYGFSVRCVRD
ncbi:MAG: fibrobacter succinogenes major paralogous domain-containing protein, partial [Bacteroidales bacterium]|nr:fibrobacter succinogenes major paralogous domain-containing protein [Bacteroidales bacterium]